MLPLKGIRVLDITRLLPGGFCTYLLSSYGAEVVKVEEPGLGDYMRDLPPLVEGTSLVHTMINRGKLSVGIDLKNQGGKEVLRRLIKRSDVFVEGFRPGAAERLGFSFEEVKKLNRRIVYCSISSFGHSSPMSSMPAHDLNIEAMSGLMGSVRRPEVPYVQLGDYVSGMYAALGIMAALQRGTRRRAEYVDVPMVQSIMSMLMLPASSYFATGRPPARGQSLVFGSEPYYGIYETADGRYLAVAAIEPRFWENLMRELGLSHLSSLRLGTRRERSRLAKEMRKVFASRTQEAWSELLMGRDTCVTPVLDIDEALESGWAKASGVVGESGGRPVLNQPLRFTPTSAGGGAPSLGEHTSRVLRRLGYRAHEIERLRLAGAVA
jgi:crotonobetainyl-CoA:carnitine CoA-transferase CaiB-like acyl-CoA transferase